MEKLCQWGIGKLRFQTSLPSIHVDLRCRLCHRQLLPVPLSPAETSKAAASTQGTSRVPSVDCFPFSLALSLVFTPSTIALGLSQPRHADDHRRGRHAEFQAKDEIKLADILEESIKTSTKTWNEIEEASGDSVEMEIKMKTEWHNVGM